jgi:hypothetical protein
MAHRSGRMRSNERVFQLVRPRLFDGPLRRRALNVQLPPVAFPHHPSREALALEQRRSAGFPPSADSLGAGGLRGIGRSYTSLRPALNTSAMAAPATRRAHMQPRARVPPLPGAFFAGSPAGVQNHNRPRKKSPGISVRRGSGREARLCMRPRGCRKP